MTTRVAEASFFLHNGCMSESNLPFVLTVIIGLAIIMMVSLFSVYNSPEKKEGAAASIIEKSAEGYILTWENGVGPMPLLSPSRMRDVSVGGGHACAISRDNKAFCWGDGEDGQLGTDGTDDVQNPTIEVAGERKWQAIAAGEKHSCGIADDGQAFCWGAGDSGQLGNGGFTGSAAPVLLAGDDLFISISAGEKHSCGITSEGLARCWGNGETGQLGDGGRENQSSPSALAGDMRFLDVSAGYDHTCAISQDGTAWCWGSNKDGQLGDGGADDSEIPASVQSDQPFSAIAAGKGYSCALSQTGEAFCWGSAHSGGSNKPFSVGKGPFQQITAGKTHTCALKGGGIWCWRMGPPKSDFMASGPFRLPVHLAPLDRFAKISVRDRLATAIVK